MKIKDLQFYTSFNSTLVQLKVIGDKGEETANHGFNSTLVQLKVGYV